jgi:hypothetical protein
VAAAAAIHTYPRAATAAAAAAIAFYVTNKYKTNHIIKISHINVNIYDKTATK